MDAFLKLLLSFVMDSPGSVLKPRRLMKKIAFFVMGAAFLLVAFIFGMRSFYAFLETVVREAWHRELFMMLLFLCLFGGVFWCYQRYLRELKKSDENSLDLEKLLRLWRSFQEGYEETSSKDKKETPSVEGTFL